MTTKLPDDIYIECDSSKFSRATSHKNTPGEFHTFLPLRYEIGHDERFEVACHDISFPVSWYNLEDDAYIIWKIDNEKQCKATIPAGLYGSASDLVKATNAAIEESVPTLYKALKQDFRFTYSPPMNMVDLTKSGGLIATSSIVAITPNLSKLLGYRLGDDGDEIKTCCDISNDIHTLYIHLDLIKDQNVGNQCEPVAQIIHVPTILTFGKIQQVTFIPRKYMQIALNEFDKIKISIKDGQGNVINFRFGTVRLWLHFRRCSVFNLPFV